MRTFFNRYFLITLCVLLLGAFSNLGAQSKKTSKKSGQSRQLTPAQTKELREKYSLRKEGLSRIPYDKLKRVLLKASVGGDLASQRAKFRILGERGSNGTVPPDGLNQALDDLAVMRTTPARRGKLDIPRSVGGIPTGAQVPPASMTGVRLPAMNVAGLQSSTWASLGPTNVGGRTRAIVFHPTDTSLIWVASAGGGIWRSANGGAKFFPVDDFMANLAVSCLVRNPTNPQIMYAGTGEGFGNSDAIAGLGIFFTNNAGASNIIGIPPEKTPAEIWKQLIPANGTRFQHVNRIAMSSDGKVLLAACDGQDAQGNFTQGIFRSIDVGHTDWIKVKNGAIGDIRCHPTDAQLAIAGGLDGKAFFTIDGGQTWKEASHVNTPWSGRVELTYAAADPNIIYASINMQGGQVWASSDGGKTYVKRSLALTNYLGEQGWYDNTIWAGDKMRKDLVIVGGIDLWRSTDGGLTLSDISTWWSAPSSAHADHHAIVAHPQYGVGNNRTVFFGNDGGIYQTADVLTVGNNQNLPRTNGWVVMNNNYAVTQVYGVGVSPSGAVVAGFQDNGHMRFTSANGPDKWANIFGGDGGFAGYDTTTNTSYGEYVFLNIHRSTNGLEGDPISGQFWNGVAWDWKQPPFVIEDAKKESPDFALFIAPFILDPNKQDRIFAGGVSLWRTDNARAVNTNTSGPIWKNIKVSIGSPISAIAATKQGAGTLVWVGHLNGRLFKTSNGEAQKPNWTEISTPSAGRMCTRITIDPKDAQRRTIYITFGGYEKNNVWKSIDGGGVWKNIGSSLPAVPVRSLVLHPQDSRYVYIGTEVGVFASDDGGTTWSPTNEGPTNCSVDDLVWNGTTLYVATHGRGVFKILIPNPAKP
jgi:photosystem II stability/assembly factor-like uncharacterized protein